MKKTTLFVLALAILVIALPAQAREHHRHENNGHQQYYQQGYITANDLLLNNVRVWVDQPMDEIRARMNHGILNPQPFVMGDYYSSSSNYGYGVSRRSPEEELSRCVGRILKDARKNHQLTTVEQAGAICTGQPIPAVAIPEPPAAAPVAQPQTQKPSMVSVKNRAGERVCVNGTNYEAGQSFEIDPKRTPMVSTIMGGTCGKAGFVWANHQTSLDLVCIRKVK